MKIRKWIYGLFFIGAAALVVLNQLGHFEGLKFSSLILTILLIPVLIESLIHLNFFGVFFSIALGGIVYAAPLGIESLTPWPILIAALLLSIGFSLIFKKKPDFKNFFGCVSETTEVLEGADVSGTVAFSESTKYLDSDCIEKGVFKCSFGSLKIFFENSTLHENGATINVECSFGSIQLYVPKAWQIHNKATSAFGAVEEKGVTSSVKEGPVVTLTGAISFGAVEIYYI